MLNKQKAKWHPLLKVCELSKTEAEQIHLTSICQWWVHYGLNNN